MPEDDAVDAASHYACDRILEGIKDDLAYFGVTYDNYFRERTLHEGGAIAATLDKLRQSGKAEEHEGALWFTMDEQQDEKDRVLVRATGEPTYFAADAAYHQDKLRRGYGLLVDIWAQIITVTFRGSGPQWRLWDIRRTFCGCCSCSS